MARCLLYDTVTLRHFAAVGKLTVCENRHQFRPAPRWTEAVHDEISEAARLGFGECRSILELAWLGSPIAPSIQDTRAMMPIWIGLNNGRRPPIDHVGEAETIYFAGALEGCRRFPKLPRGDHRNSPVD
jgi:hypothetical protein